MSPSNGEYLLVQLHVDIAPELKEAIGQAADAENIPLNHLVSRLLAKGLKRPDLERVPAKRVGRPRKLLKV